MSFNTDIDVNTKTVLLDTVMITGIITATGYGFGRVFTSNISKTTRLFAISAVITLFIFEMYIGLRKYKIFETSSYYLETSKLGVPIGLTGICLGVTLKKMNLISGITQSMLVVPVFLAAAVAAFVISSEIITYKNK